MMSAEDAATIIDSISKLVSSVIWPAVIVFLFLRYRDSFKNVIESLSEFSVKMPGVEASAKKAEARDALVAAAIGHRDAGTTPEIAAKEATAAASAVDEVTPELIRQASGSIVLWVDDRPRNNKNERRALEALGVRFVIAISTDDAFKILQSNKFDAIISDMGRPPDDRAGYTLLDKLRRSGNTTPFVIYAGSRAPEHIEESRQHGALGCTNRANELFEYVISAITCKSKMLS